MESVPIRPSPVMLSQITGESQRYLGQKNTELSAPAQKSGDALKAPLPAQAQDFIERTEKEGSTPQQKIEFLQSEKDEKRKQELDVAEQERLERLEAARKEREEQRLREKAEKEAEKKAIEQAEREEELHGKLDEIRARLQLNLNDLAERKRAVDDLMALRKAWDRQIDLFA